MPTSDSRASLQWRTRHNYQYTHADKSGNSENRRAFGAVAMSLWSALNDENIVRSA